MDYRLIDALYRERDHLYTSDASTLPQEENGKQEKRKKKNRKKNGAA